jgi:hypothetical protein
MKWDVDKALGQLEDLLGGRVPGTGINRVYTDAQHAYKNGIRPRPDDGQTIVIWCLSYGASQDPKLFFYGRTIREMYLRTRRHLLKKRILTRRKPSEHGRRKKASSSS